jgi:glycosyltransferase involved in cell wall biosynthesis
MAKASLHVLISSRDVVFGDEGVIRASIHGAWTPDTRVILDIYSLDHPVHPEGHLGWWRFAPTDSSSELEFRLSRQSGSIHVRLNGVEPQDSWLNTGLSSQRLAIHVVLRSNATNALLWEEQVPVFATAEELASFRAKFNRNWATPRYALAPYVFDASSTVHLVAPDIFQRDAVGNLALDVFRMLRQNGIPTRLFAANADLAINDLVEPRVLLASQVSPSDHIIYFFSTADPLLMELTELPARKTVYFHGITDPKKLRVFDPELAAAAAKALATLNLIERFDAVIANSRASAAILAEAVEVPLEHIAIVPPVLVSPEGRDAGERAGGVDLLCVGQLAPHKKIEDVLRLFAEYVRMVPHARCHVVGRRRNPAYFDYLRWVEKDELGLPDGKVIWHGSVPDDELRRLYGSSGALVSMSEDEGFCLPVFEAMGAGLPVLAHGVAAVRETLGGAGLAFGAKRFGHLARAVVSLLEDNERQQALVERQYRRYADLRAQMTGAQFFQFVEPDWAGTIRD